MTVLMNGWLFRDIECELIQSPDDELRFHSGTPKRYFDGKWCATNHLIAQQVVT